MLSITKNILMHIIYYVNYKRVLNNLLYTVINSSLLFVLSTDSLVRNMLWNLILRIQIYLYKSICYSKWTFLYIQLKFLEILQWRFCFLNLSNLWEIFTLYHYRYSTFNFKIFQFRLIVEYQAHCTYIIKTLMTRYRQNEVITLGESTKCCKFKKKKLAWTDLLVALSEFFMEK